MNKCENNNLFSQLNEFSVNILSGRRVRVCICLWYGFASDVMGFENCTPCACVIWGLFFFGRFFLSVGMFLDGHFFRIPSLTSVCIMFIFSFSRLSDAFLWFFFRHARFVCCSCDISSLWWLSPHIHTCIKRKMSDRDKCFAGVLSVFVMLYKFSRSSQAILFFFSFLSDSKLVSLVVYFADGTNVCDGRKFTPSTRKQTFV